MFVRDGVGTWGLLRVEALRIIRLLSDLALSAASAVHAKVVRRRALLDAAKVRIFSSNERSDLPDRNSRVWPLRYAMQSGNQR
jgi:hypothetical protein